MQALIGCTGLIGQLLNQHLKFDHYFTGKNIDQLSQFDYNTVYCAAPSGNRIIAEKYPETDAESVDRLISALLETKIDRVVLISTCDTQVNPQTHYGRNRLRLETAVRENWPCHHIVRLSSLIHSTIKKNILYDIRHAQYIDKINPNTQLQWYPLDHLIQDLDCCIKSEIRELNLCSEPIANQQIIDLFGKHIQQQVLPGSAGHIYNLTPYRYTADEIFDHMREYFK